jgi:hypothetical protein
VNKSSRDVKMCEEGTDEVRVQREARTIKAREREWKLKSMHVMTKANTTYVCSAKQQPSYGT